MQHHRRASIYDGLIIYGRKGILRGNLKTVTKRFRASLPTVFILVILAIFILAGLISCSSEKALEPLQPAAKPRTPKNVVRGKAVFEEYCSPCHGIDGKGDGPNAKNLAKLPRNFTDADYMEKKTDRELFNAISGGGASVGLSQLMPNWGSTLKDWEIRDVISYLRQFHRKE